MRIDGNEILLQSLLRSDTRIASGRSDSQNVSNSKGSSDHLDISALDVSILDLVGEVKKAPVIRAERVEAIATELFNGTYDVRAEEVAQSIITGNLLDELG